MLTVAVFDIGVAPSGNVAAGSIVTLKLTDPLSPGDFVPKDHVICDPVTEPKSGFVKILV